MFTQDRVSFIQDTIKLYASEEYESFIKPAYGNGSIADIPNILKRNLGLNSGKSAPSLMKDAVLDVDHMIFFLLDGFGHNMAVQALSRYRTPNLEKFIRGSSYVPITSLFPSTTSTATFTYHTDMHPLEHGVIGYTSYLPEIGTVCNMTSLSPLGRSGSSILDQGWRFTVAKQNVTIHQELGMNGIRSFHYLPNSLMKTGMTRVTSVGASSYGYFSIPDMLSKIRKNIVSLGTKSLHFCYVPSIDTISHKMGPYAEEVAMEMDSIFYMIREYLVKRLETNDRIGIMISADHGHTLIPRENVRDVRRDRELSDMLLLPITGDFRAPILHVAPESKEYAMEYLTVNYGNIFSIATSQELITKGYFGSGVVSKRNLGAFGDIILLPKENVGLMDSNLGILEKRFSEFDMEGMHGGLSQDEMIVPLIYTTLNDGSYNL